MTILLKNNVFLKAAIIVYSVDLPWILVRERELFSKDTEGIYPRNPYHHGNGSSSKIQRYRKKECWKLAEFQRDKTASKNQFSPGHSISDSVSKLMVKCSKLNLILQELYEHMNSSLGGTSLEGSQVYLGKSLFLQVRRNALFSFCLACWLHVKLHDQSYISIWYLNSPTKIQKHYCIKHISAFQNNNGSFSFPYVNADRSVPCHNTGRAREREICLVVSFYSKIFQVGVLCYFHNQEHPLVCQALSKSHFPNYFLKRIMITS